MNEVLERELQRITLQIAQDEKHRWERYAFVFLLGMIFFAVGLAGIFYGFNVRQRARVEVATMSEKVAHAESRISQQETQIAVLKHEIGQQTVRLAAIESE